MRSDCQHRHGTGRQDSTTAPAFGTRFNTRTFSASTVPSDTPISRRVRPQHRRGCGRFVENKAELFGSWSALQHCAHSTSVSNNSFTRSYHSAGTFHFCCGVGGESEQHAARDLGEHGYCLFPEFPKDSFFFSFFGLISNVCLVSLGNFPLFFG